jgi:hypothetical protein
MIIEEKIKEVNKRKERIKTPSQSQNMKKRKTNK